MQSSSAKKVLDARLGQALQSGSPADISAAYKELADFHFEMRNMAAADELYAFSALHSRGSSNAISISEYGNADADESEGTNQSTVRQLLHFDSDDGRSNASFPQASPHTSPRSSQYPTPRGGGNPCTTLSVTVLEAQHLASLPATAGASQSVFCTVTLECPGKTSITVRTDLVPWSDSPKWNARFEFRVDDLAVHQGIVNVAIMSRSIFSPSAHPMDAAADHASALQLAVSRMGVVRAIRLHQIDSANGSLQRWFTVSPAPEQEVGGDAGRQTTNNKCCLALMLSTSEARVLVGSRRYMHRGLLSATEPGPSHSSTPLPSPSLVLTPGVQDDGENGDGGSHMHLRGASGLQPREFGETSADATSLRKWRRKETAGMTSTGDMTWLKRSLERKPEGKVWFEAPAIVALTLDQNFNDISWSQEARRKFQDRLSEDVAAALGLARRQILVFGLRCGSLDAATGTLATIGIIVPRGGPSLQELTAQLEKQILDPKESVLMQGRVTRKAMSVQRLDDLSSSLSRTLSRDPSELSLEARPLQDSAIVMASPRLPVVFQGASVHPSRSPHPRPDSPQDVPTGFVLPRSLQAPENVIGPRTRELQEQDGVHEAQNPRDQACPKSAADGLQVSSAADGLQVTPLRLSPVSKTAELSRMLSRDSIRDSPLSKTAERASSSRQCLSGLSTPGLPDELGSILSARKKQVDEATGTRQAGAGGLGVGDARQSSDESATTIMDPRDSGALKQPVSRLSLDLMYDKAGSQNSGGVEGASLGLGPVKYINPGMSLSPSPSAPATTAVPETTFSKPNQSAGSAPALSTNQGTQLWHRPMGQERLKTQDPRPQTATAGAPGGTHTHTHTQKQIPLVVMPLPPKWQKAQIKTLVCGTIAHAPRFGHVEILDEAAVIVDATGKILLVATKDAEEEEENDILAWVQRFNVGTCTPVVQSESERAGSGGGGHMDVIRLARGQVLVPGFIDTHIHAPQYPYTGTATDKPLMEWLNHYTFPAERRLADENIAAQVYSTVVDRTLRSGTTTALYFGTIHLPASKILVDIAHHRGQRAFVGKVCMDRNSPADYCETTQKSLDATEAFIQYVRSLATELVQPVITPRFIPTCSPELLRGLGQLARKYECHIQSHISESHDEMEIVADLHPGEGSDADIFDRHGLLTDKCVMAHGVHLNKDDAELLRSRGTAVAHCPLSNFFFGDGVLATAKLVGMGVKVGLGSDVAGGYCPCMLSSIRNAVVAHRALRQGGRQSVDCLSSSYKTCYQRAAASAAAGNAHKWRLADMPEELDWRHAFNLATMGGAQALGIENEVGTIEAGKSFDAVLLDVAGGGIDLSHTDDSTGILEKLLNLGSEHNVSKVWVKGRSVHHKPVYRGRPRPSPEHRAHPSPAQPALPPQRQGAAVSPRETRVSPRAEVSPRMSGAGDFCNNPASTGSIPASPQRHSAQAPRDPPLFLPVFGSPTLSPQASGGTRRWGPVLPVLSASGLPLAPHLNPQQVRSRQDLPAPPPTLGTTNNSMPIVIYPLSGSPDATHTPKSGPSPAQAASPLSPPEPIFSPPGGVYKSDTSSDDVSDLEQLEHSFSDTDQDVGAC